MNSIFGPVIWQDVLLYGTALAVAIEIVTCVCRFALGLKSTEATARAMRWTRGMRVHHGYVGIVLILVSMLWPLAPVVRAVLAVVGTGLSLSDLLHHFAVLWPLTGHHEFFLTYPQYREQERRANASEVMAASSRGAVVAASVGQLRPYAGDPIAAYAIECLNTGPLGFAALSFVFLSAVNIALNALQGTLWPTDEMPAALFSLEWATHWTIVPVLGPLLFVGIAAVYAKIPAMFDALLSSGVVESEGDPSSYFRRLSRRYAWKTLDIVIVPIVIVSFVVTIGVKMRQGTSDWTHVEPGRLTVAAWYWYAAMHIAAYMVMRLAFAVYVTSMAIRDIFRQKAGFRVQPRMMHPDRCAGLSPISSFVLRISGVLFVFGLMCAVFLVVSVYRHGGAQTTLAQIGQPVLLMLYVIAAPVAFFLPLLPAHKLMSSAKQEFLKELSRQFDAKFRSLGDRIGEGEVSAKDVESLAALESLYGYASKIPVWPFDAGTLSRFAATVVLPVLTALVPSLLKRLFP